MVAITRFGDSSQTKIPGTDVYYQGTHVGTSSDEGELSFPFCESDTDEISAIHEGRRLKLSVASMSLGGRLQIIMTVRSYSVNISKQGAVSYEMKKAGHVKQILNVMLFLI